MRFNEGPVWLFDAIGRAWSKVEAYGSPVLLALIVLYVIYKTFLEKKYKQMIAPPFAVIRERMNGHGSSCTSSNASGRNISGTPQSDKSSHSRGANGRDGTFADEMSRIRERQQRELEEAARLRAAKLKEEGVSEDEGKKVDVKKSSTKSSISKRPRGMSISFEERKRKETILKIKI